MANYANKYRTGLLTAVSGALLLHAPAPAQTPPPPNSALLRTYLPAITAAISNFNPDPLAVVDTLPNRHQLGDGVPDQAVPLQYISSRGALGQSFPPLTNIPGTCTGTDNQGHPVSWSIGTNIDAGHSIIDSTSTQYLQFLAVTCGSSDNHQAVTSAQTWYRIGHGPPNNVTFGPFKQLIGPGFTPTNPMPGLIVGKNGYQLPGDTLIISSNQEQDVLLPIAFSPPLDSNGNPVQSQYNVTSYAEAHILRGHWRSDGSDLDWQLGQAAQVPQTESTRGLDETAIVEMATNGHCIIVSRGSNEGNLSLVGHYWLFESQDGCRTWVNAGIPLGWDDGSTYYAPAAAPFLYKDANNRLIFMGANSDPNNSNANSPRTRVVAAELDLTQLKLLKHTAVIVDEKYGLDTDSVDLIFGNFYYPQSTGNIFYYARRQDLGNPCPAGTNPANSCYPHNWHLLHPIPPPSASFVISADPTVPNQVDWPAIPNAQSFIVYARNPSHQGFWELQGSVSGSAAGHFSLQSLPSNTDVEVTVFAAADPNGVLTSSNQITIHTH